MKQLAIRADVHERLRAYCKANGLKIGFVAAAAIDSYLDDRMPPADITDGSQADAVVENDADHDRNDTAA